MCIHIADRFAFQYYEWSLERSKEECRSGFPLLSLVKGTHAFTFLEIAQTLAPNVREQFCVALVKRFHPRAGALGHFTMTCEEQELVDIYLNHRYESDASGGVAMRPFGSQRERALTERWESQAAKKPKRSVIKKLVGRALQGYGTSQSSGGSGELIYRTIGQGWSVDTHIDFGNTWGPMVSYAHVLIPDGQAPIIPDVHICGWMGIAGQTQWDLFTDEEVGEVADGVATLVKWFSGCWQDLIAVK